jgi:hypothetical protein
MMNDPQLRTGVKQTILARYANDPETRIFDELGVRHGAARIDIAVVNGIIHGFELKSDRDTLKRLPHQVRMYSSVFDKVTLVTTARHKEAAVSLLPEWWGIKIALANRTGTLEFSDLREARDNPSLDIGAVSKLLWRAEALTLLDDFGEADSFRDKRRALVYARLAEVADLDTVRRRVRRQLKSRETWRVGR